MATALEVEGGTIEVAWAGERPGRRLPIVLLHEGLGSVSLWRDFPAALAERTGRAVMCYSRFGHGASSPPPVPPSPRVMHEEAARLPAILEAAGIGRAIVFGHSDGGSIALIAAAADPGRFDALILEAPHVFVEEVSVDAITERTAAFHDPTHDLRRRLSRHHRDVEMAFAGWSRVWLDPQFRAWTLEPLLPAVTSSLLLIQGEDDRYGTRRQLDAICRQAQAPCEVVLYPDCGHSPHRDRRDDVLSLVSRFVRSRA